MCRRKEVLVVVDMQAHFYSSRDIVDQVRKEVAKAKRRQWPIIFVEYSRSGPTLPAVMLDALAYEHRYMTIKTQDNGAAEVELIIKHYQWELAAIRMCGVLSTHCVLDTSVGLAKAFPKVPVKVLTHACAPGGKSIWASYNRTDLPNLRTTPRSKMLDWLKLAG